VGRYGVAREAGAWRARGRVFRGAISAGGSQAAFPAGELPVSTMVEVTRLVVPQAKIEISVVARVAA
jgi:enamine deaminase RidA (YjgF/YER057c/UK114 family)